MIKGTDIAYQSDSANLTGYIAWDSAIAGKRPVVFIVHEWWGLNDYVKGRARQLAELGYLAFAVDFYGDGKMGNNPDEAGKLATPFYTNPELARSRFEAAMNAIRSNPEADTTKMAAIGYCFGGSMVLNMAKMGEPLSGVVSFHGGLAGVQADKSKLKAKVLVCHGADDKFVSAEEVARFRKEMDSVNADYEFKSYPGATHAFSNPDATQIGERFKIPVAYNAAADTSSWKEMKGFLEKVFK